MPSNPRSRRPPRSWPKRRRPTIPRRSRRSRPWRRSRRPSVRTRPWQRSKRPSRRSSRTPRPRWRRRCSMLPPSPRRIPRPRPTQSTRPSTTTRASRPESSRSTKKLPTQPLWSPRSRQRHPMAYAPSPLSRTLPKNRRRRRLFLQLLRATSPRPVAYWKELWLRRVRPFQLPRHPPRPSRRFSPGHHRVNEPSPWRNWRHRQRQQEA
mmetsp:Transcript_26602/g.62270  ORF Transcript_26602/g.62270 Transcript_26602/m.62270 type:complete len:208 (+) Transcript_26602:1549-2172(+)